MDSEAEAKKILKAHKLLLAVNRALAQNEPFGWKSQLFELVLDVPVGHPIELLHRVSHVGHVPGDSLLCH